MTVIDESLTAKGFTPRASVPLVYARPRTIEAITIHWWGAYGQTHSGVNNFFVNGPGNTSAHFVASGVPVKRINCLVNPWDAAWHAGNAIGNASTIGIECRPEATDADYEVVAELVRFLRDTYGANLPLIPHRYWQSTACPGNYDLARIHRMAEALKTPNVVVKPVPIPPKPIVNEIMKLEHLQETIKVNLPLKAGQQVTLKKGTANWNLATEGLGYYDIDVFVQGTGLEDGEKLSVQAFIVTSGDHRSGFFTQSVDGNTGGVFEKTVSIKTPILSTAKIEIDVKATTDCVLTILGNATYAFKV
jgi:N-acetylmuramoyl-L-alanine amidase